MKLYSHRGRGLGLPEATLNSFRAAVKRGMYIECDLRLAPGGAIVVRHDPWPAETATEGLPTLDDIIGLMREDAGVRALWEIKEYDPALIERVVGAVRSHGLEQRVIVIGSRAGLRGFAGDAGALHRLAKTGIVVGMIDPWPVAMLREAEKIGVRAVLTGWTSRKEKLEFRALAPFLRIKKQLKDLHSAGFHVILGVARNKQDIAYFTRLGADAIVSDIPPTA